MNICICGCGTQIPKRSYGRKLTYAHGHNWRGKSRGGMTDKQKLGKTISCACGCGEKITEYRIKASGHRYKVKMQVGHMWKAKDHHFWEGGKTSEARRIKQSYEYRQWRKAVFERDKYTCVLCGVKNTKGLGKTVELHPDHIKPQSIYPELRLDINNGRTLCAPCHRETDTYGIKLVHSSRQNKKV